MQQYQDLVKKVLQYGKQSDDRTGQGTLYLFGESIKFDLNAGFPIVTARKINYKAAIGELCAFLRGATKASEFRALGCNYWSSYGENLGPIYGAQWVNWGDQLATLVKNLKTDPFSRRHILSTWNVEELDSMVLPPCHILAQFDVSPDNMKLSCIVYQRSVDLMLGAPYDFILYAALTQLLAVECGYALGDLKFFFGNTHIYKPHLYNANIVAQAPTHPLPRLHIDAYLPDIEELDPAHFVVTKYEHSGPLDFELFK